MSNTQFRVPHDWGEESNAEIRITATATLVSTPLETDFTDQCGRGIVRHPSFKLKVLVPTIAVMSVAGISTERTSSTPVPPQGSIEGTGSVRFPQDWRVGAYVSSIAGDGSHTAWVLKGPVSVSDGKWSISGVDFRLPGHTGSTSTTMLVVAGKDLPRNLQQNEIRSLQGTAHIQPEVITVTASAPEVTISRSDCGRSSAAARDRILGSCDSINAEGTAKNMLESEESLCVAVTPSIKGQEYPLSGVQAPVQNLQKWKVRIEKLQPSKSLELVVGIAFDRGQGLCSVPGDKVVARKAFIIPGL